MKKILLLYPPSPFLTDQRSLAPLGCLQIGACMEQWGWEPTVVDLAGDEGYVKSALDAMVEGYDAVGVSTTTQQTSYVRPTIEAILKEYPRAHTVAGGPGPTMDPETYRKMGFTVTVKGDGETAKAAFEPGAPAIFHAQMVEDLDALPWPDRDLVDIKSYSFRVRNKAGEPIPSTHTLTQRGCPMSCNFCSGREIPEYRTVRVRSPENIVAELDHLHDRYGYNAFQLYDDEVNLLRGRTLKLCEALAKRNYCLRGFIISHPNALDEEVMAALSKAGFTEVCAGVESGSDRVLKRNKIYKTSYATSLRAVQMAHKYGIRFKAFTMVGLPGSTREDDLITKKWLLEARPDDFDVTCHLAMPGSPIAIHPEQNPDYHYEPVDWTTERSFYKGKPGDYKALSWPEGRTPEELVATREEIDRDVRKALNLTWFDGGKARNFTEASMGQFSPLSYGTMGTFGGSPGTFQPKVTG